MWTVILDLLEGIGMRLLGALFQSMTSTAQASGLDSSALDYVNQCVASAEVNPNLDTPAKKFAQVQLDVGSYFTANWPEVGASFVNALIELSVHNLHATAKSAPAAIPPGSTPAPAPGNTTKGS